MNSVQRIARNSIIPIAAQFFNKLLDVAFMIVAIRLLGVEGIGSYDFAVYIWLLVKTASDFGLNILATRELARSPEREGQWFGGGVTARLLVLAATMPLLLVALMGLSARGSLPDAATAAIFLLVLSIVPGAVADSATAVLQAREDMVTPALVTIMSTVLKVVIGGLVLLGGGYVAGLAATSVITNTVTALVLWSRVRPLASPTRWWPGLSLLTAWISSAWPLLLNNLLANLFFRVDIFVVQVTRGTTELGLYTAAYRFVNFALIVPPYVTMALFPGMARQALHDHHALRQTLRQATTYLLLLAFLGAMLTTLLAEPLVWILAGQAFLPGSAAALRVVIWFLPLSYVNGILQYVLIALDRQRVITAAFGLTVVFNLAANVLLVPRFGYLAAAAVTVASEVVLLIPLLIALRAALGDLGLISATWRPLVAAAGMALAGLLVWPYGPAPAAAAATAAYVAVLALLGAWGDEERRLLRALRGASDAA